MPPNFEPKFGFLTNDPTFFEIVFSPNAPVLCPKLGGVAGPFSLAGLLNWGGAKTGNWRVDKDREDQGTNGGLMGIWKLKRLMT